jgi:uncharacterized membrane protein YphA (DoxX/SURF4 family)
MVYIFLIVACYIKHGFLCYNLYMNIKKFRIFILSLVFLSPITTLAHVKWFAEAQEPVRNYQITDSPVILAIIISLLIILLGIYLDKKLRVPNKLNKYIEAWAPKVLSLASIGFGLAFIIFSIQGFIFAPNLQVASPLGTSMLVLQFLAGILILFGLYERVGGVLILVLFIFGVQEYGMYEMLDTMEMIGFAIYIILIGRPKWKIRDLNLIEPVTQKFHKYGLPILRVGTGLNLIILGFTEKILAPSLTDNFLNHYNWNFMQGLGFEWFTNYWFAFSAGAVEILFGIFFLFGLITRTTTILLAVFLATTLVLLGPIELVGHLPHFSIAIVLLVLGSGSKLLLLKK